MSGLDHIRRLVADKVPLTNTQRFILAEAALVSIANSLRTDGEAVTALESSDYDYLAALVAGLVEQYQRLHGVELPAPADASTHDLLVALRDERRDHTLSCRYAGTLEPCSSPGPTATEWTPGPWIVHSTSAHISIAIAPPADTERDAIIAALSDEALQRLGLVRP